MASDPPRGWDADGAVKPGSRYEPLVKIASGGMATVFVGRLRGAVGFWRLVALKRAHAHLVENATFRRMLVAEARLASRIHHANVVAVQDVEELAGQLLLVMDYVEGAALSELMTAAFEADRPLPGRVAVRIALDACAGLHAAHELTDEHGEPLRLVHRDVSPQNILVGLDGISRLSDFGIAKCRQQSAAGPGSTTAGSLKGKLAYMAPEYVEHGELDARSDVFGMGVVVWEALANRRLFRGDNELETLQRVARADAPTLSSVAPWLGKRLDGVLARALARDPADRFASAKEFAEAIERAVLRQDLVASHSEVGAFVRSVAGDAIERRRARVRERTRGAEPEPAARLERDTAPEPAMRAARLAADAPAAGDRVGTPPAAAASAADAVTAALPRPAAHDDPPSTLAGSGLTPLDPTGEDLDAAGVPRRGAGRWLVAATLAAALVGAGVLSWIRMEGAASAPTSAQGTIAPPGGASALPAAAGGGAPPPPASQYHPPPPAATAASARSANAAPTAAPTAVGSSPGADRAPGRSSAAATAGSRTTPPTVAPPPKPGATAPRAAPNPY